MIPPRIGPFIVLALVLAITGTARAQQVLQGIAAVVNDEVISAYDVRTRLRIVITSSGLPATRDVRDRLAPQVLRDLIDEKLKLQEAERQGVGADDDDLAHARAGLERQNNLQPGQLGAFLAARGIDESALEAQIESAIAWQKLIARRLIPQINVSAEEIDETMRRIADNAGKPEHLLAEIFLPVDNPRDAANVEKAATRLVSQVRDGANFVALARSFSKSSTAADGGDMGWIPQGQLEPELDSALARMQPGQVSDPVATLAGYHVLLLRDRRISKGLEAGPPAKLTLHQVFEPLAATAGSAAERAAADKLRQLTSGAASCEDMDRLGKRIATAMSGSLGTLEETTLPPSIRAVVGPLAVNTPSRPVRTEQGMVVLMVCNRSGGASREAARDKVREMLVDRRAEKAAQRLMLDLRRNAMVDVRL